MFKIIRILEKLRKEKIKKLDKFEDNIKIITLMKDYGMWLNENGLEDSILCYEKFLSQYEI